MTQEELAELAGVTRNTIISMEKNKYCPSLKLAYRISHVFSVGSLYAALSLKKLV
jgi:putative transcriptional regulator